MDDRNRSPLPVCQRRIPGVLAHGTKTAHTRCVYTTMVPALVLFQIFAMVSPDLNDVIEEQEAIFKQEFDYELEGANLRRMRDNVQVTVIPSDEIISMVYLFFHPNSRHTVHTLRRIHELLPSTCPLHSHSLNA